MTDRRDDHRPLIGETSSGNMRLLVDLGSVDEENIQTDQNFFTRATLSRFVEPKTSPHRSHLLHVSVNWDENNEETNLVEVLAPSPEIPRRESHNFSICEEGFVTNVRPIINLAVSPRVTSHPAECSPTSLFIDRHLSGLVHDISTNADFFHPSELEAYDPELDYSSSGDADIEAGSDLSSQLSRKFAPLPSFQPSNTIVPVVGLTKTKEALPTPHPKKKISTYLAASVENLDFEESSVLILSQDSLVADKTGVKSKSTSDMRMSKASITTRSTPDLGKAVRPKHSKPIPSYPKPDYSKVESKVRQYKKALAALSKKPRVPEPISLPTESVVSSSDPKPTLTRTTHPKSNSVDNVTVSASGIIRSSTRVVSNSSSCLKSTNTTTTGTQTLPETYSEAKWISQRSRNSQYDPVGEYVQDIWDILDLTTKEKRIYEEAYKRSEKKVKRLQLEAAHVRQMVEKTIRSRRLSRIETNGNDAVATPKRKMSSVSSSSGWITSSSSDSHLYSGSRDEEAVDTVLGHEDTFSRERSTFKAEIHASSAEGSSQVVRERGTSMESSQDVKPSVVMGVRHKIALAKNTTTLRKRTLDEKELDKLADFAFAPLAGQRNRSTVEDDKAAAAVAMDPQEDLIQSASKLSVQSEEDEGSRQIGKMMWSAGFFLNKTATAIVPEVQYPLNLCNPKKFFSFRKLTSKLRKRSKLRVGENSVHSSISSVASSQTSLSSIFRAKFHPPNKTSKNRRRSKSCEKLHMFAD